MKDTETRRHGDTETRASLSASPRLRVSASPHFLCHLCQRTLPADKFPRLLGYHKQPWVCRACQKDYVIFRRYFKLEHGRYPTIAEYRSE